MQCQKLIFFISFWLVFHPAWYCFLRNREWVFLLIGQNLLSGTKLFVDAAYTPLGLTTVGKPVSSNPPVFQVKKIKTPGNFSLFFLHHLWRFHFFFNDPMEFPHSIFSIHLEIPRPQRPCLDFLWNSPIIW